MRLSTSRDTWIRLNIDDASGSPSTGHWRPSCCLTELHYSSIELQGWQEWFVCRLGYEAGPILLCNPGNSVEQHLHPHLGCMSPSCNSSSQETHSPHEQHRSDVGLRSSSSSSSRSSTAVRLQEEVLQRGASGMAGKARSSNAEVAGGLRCLTSPVLVHEPACAPLL